MSWERDAYDTMLRDHKRKTRRSDGAEVVRLAQQAKVAAGMLTNDPKWDSFLSLISARREQAVEGLEQTRAALTKPSIAGSPSALHALREQAIGFETVIGELDYVSGLPKTLLERSKEAIEQNG